MTLEQARLRMRLARALRRQCPRCGGREVVRGLSTVEDCPTCGLRFEREPGYWVGAMIISTTITLGGFLVLMVGGVVVLWPQVPWPGLLGALLAWNLAVPILGYPVWRLIWVAYEITAHPLEPEEIDAARSRLRG